jgi:mannose-6-phosphate isomerase class I
MLKTTNFEKCPHVSMEAYTCILGWQNIAREVMNDLQQVNGKKIIVIECYPGVDQEEIVTGLLHHLPQAHLIHAADAMRSPEEINEMVYPYVTDDPVFGYITSLHLHDLFCEKKIAQLEAKIADTTADITFIIGTGASLLTNKAQLLLYADMPRWEIQLRFRKNKTGNLGVTNPNDPFSYQYRRAFFVDWRVCDRHKKELMHKWDYLVDTTVPNEPKMVAAATMATALAQTVAQPFRVVPFFDPGPWGGQWLKEVVDLDRSQPNFAWGFDCVPEENSLLLKFANASFEIPAINAVFKHPQELLGTKVYEAFGAEFPIRFDFLDTMNGGNLSLQVHPLLQYIRDNFGMGYTQDESYYFMEAADDAVVYLGVKENISPEAMIAELEEAQKTGNPFEAEKYVEKWPVKKHDHVLIPSGTVHCSGANSVVLEISATPYIFTFKLWDWGRMGLDGKPRPISIEHGKKVIQWDRTGPWVEKNILERVEPVATGEGWREERTGLDDTSFIETRRHWFTEKVPHDTNGVVNVLNLIEGREVLVESPTGAFAPYVIHYAETFIVPAAVGAYTITPYGESAGQPCATIKASVRTNNLINYQKQ